MPPTPATSPQPPLWRSARTQLRLLVAAVRTPSHAAAPLFATSERALVRYAPFVIAFVAVAILLPTSVTVVARGYGLSGPAAGALGVAQTAPLLLAVTRPLQAWWIVFTADVLGGIALAGASDVTGHSWPWTPMVIIGYVILMVFLGLRESRRALIAVWLATGLAGTLFELVRSDLSDGSWLLMLVLSGVVLVVTGALRERGDAQRRLAAQETISEAERAQRTLLEERTRIARELHDVVAHHMSVITVQADSAPYRITGLPDEAREEFTAIAASARESLTEMRRLLAVLRSEGADGELAPQPGVARVQQLVEATVRAGVPVELSLSVPAGSVPQAVDLSAYRIVQEALSNVVRHAPGAATRASVVSDGTDLIVVVVNGPAEAAASPLESAGTGHGLVGMRERVRLTGGTLDTGPLPDGGFRVAARLPLAPSASDGPDAPDVPAAPVP
ncbi:sensor histidine kinase [Streptomyces sp. NPDC017979]|uniref:sensor histidine kinase n=1 Tax=Streptomyces sp. NPDC017979 TaxID=3365024 RepID=UPI0037A8D417